MLVVKNLEPWAKSHQQRWHAEALQMFGERVVFRHRWNIQDYALGRVARCIACSAGVRLNEKQRIRLSNVESGTFTISFAGQQTAPLPYDVSRSELQDALDNLEVNSPGDIFITGDGIQLDGLTVEFRGNWAYNESIPTMTVDTTSLSSGAIVKINTVQEGSGGTNVEARVSSAYKQAGDSWCTKCFGTGFDGGFEPIIYVTYAIIGDQDQETTRSRSGAIQREDPEAEFSFEPQVQEYDLVARVLAWEEDNITPKRVAGRFMLRDVHPITLRTGPGTPDDSVAIMPESLRTQYQIPTPDWIIGQKCQIEILPYEHVLNLVPLSRYEETLVEEGILTNRRWYERAEAKTGMEVRETHP